LLEAVQTLAPQIEERAAETEAARCVPADLAQQLADAGAAVVVDETIEPDEFLVIVNELLSNDHRRFELAKNLYSTAKPDATAKLSAMIIKNAKKQV